MLSSAEFSDVTGGGPVGGGGAGTFTFTVADAFALPPGPFAVRRYVVVLLGNTVRLPLVCTVPNAGSIDTVVAPVTDQRSVADCPRSIEDGSAVNCAMTGA